MFTACLRANYLTLERHVQARHFAEEEMPRKLKAKRAAEYFCRPLPKSCLIDLLSSLFNFWANDYCLLYCGSLLHNRDGTHHDTLADKHCGHRIPLYIRLNHCDIHLHYDNRCGD